MLRYDYISDIHIPLITKLGELVSNQTQRSKLLVIGGDISDGDKPILGFLQLLGTVYPKILFVDGNHEHYASKRTIEEHEQYFAENSTEEIQYLFNKPCIIGGTAFVGCNGWYDFNCHHSHDPNMVFVDYKSKMNDHRYIKNVDSFQQMLELATRHADTLEQNIKEVYDLVEKIVVTTHTAPSPMFLVDRNHSWYDLNGAFCNTLFKNIIDKYGDKITNWHYGHTHYDGDLRYEGIRYINNSYGYDHERQPNAGIKSYSA